MATPKDSVFRPDNINTRVYSDTNYGNGGFLGVLRCPTFGGAGPGLGTYSCGGPPGGGASGVWRTQESRLGVVNGCKNAQQQFGGVFIFEDSGTKWILAKQSTEHGPSAYSGRNTAVTNANADEACGDWFIPSCAQTQTIADGTSTYWDFVGDGNPQPAPNTWPDTHYVYWGTGTCTGNGNNVCAWSIRWASNDKTDVTGTRQLTRTDQANTFCAPWSRSRAFRTIS